jgi:hypothetical protein
MIAIHVGDARPLLRPFAGIGGKSMGGQAIELWRMPDRIQFPNQYNEYKKQVKDLNKSLQKSGLPRYKENDSAIQMPCVPDFSIELRRSEAHSFRLLVAKLIDDPNWIPPNNTKEYYPVSRDDYQRICDDSGSHTAAIPDVYGFYIPVPFKSLRTSPMPIIGSSIAFRDELRELASRLNLSDAELDSYASDPRMPEYSRIEELSQEAFGQEKGILLSAYAIAAASIHYNCIIYCGEF